MPPSSVPHKVGATESFSCLARKSENHRCEEYMLWQFDVQEKNGSDDNDFFTAKAR
jgi:hypothetical protein